ncbi:MAG: hypothetical protein ACPGLY_04885, partial [Rubripirellula sp.]
MGTAGFETGIGEERGCDSGGGRCCFVSTRSSEIGCSESTGDFGPRSAGVFLEESVAWLALSGWVAGDAAC